MDKFNLNKFEFKFKCKFKCNNPMRREIAILCSKATGDTAVSAAWLANPVPHRGPLPSRAPCLEGGCQESPRSFGNEIELNLTFIRSVLAHQ